MLLLEIAEKQFLPLLLGMALAYLLPIIFGQGAALA